LLSNYSAPALPGGLPLLQCFSVEFFREKTPELKIIIDDDFKHSPNARSPHVLNCGEALRRARARR